jgi:ABC-type Fe3+-hydroxamate transport system substrate-binding protein
LRKVFCETLGTQLNLPDTLHRIISFSPAVTETLFLLGVGDSLVGVSAFCARPPEARKKKVVGSYNTVDKRILEELHPDLVFTTTGYQREFALRMSRDLPVYAIELPVSVVGILDMVVKTGLIINKIPEANTLARTLLERLASLKPVRRKLRVYLEIDFGGPVSFGAYSYITDALRLLGVDSIYGDSPCEWLTPDLKFVGGSNPDVVIYEAKMFSGFQDADLKRLIEERGWREMDAARRGYIFRAPGPLDFFAHHGPSFISATIPWLRGHLEAVVSGEVPTSSAAPRPGWSEPELG